MIQELNKMRGAIFKKFQNLNEKNPLNQSSFFNPPWSIKILLDRFWAIYMRIIPDKFQLSIFKTVGGDRVDRQTDFN